MAVHVRVSSCLQRLAQNLKLCKQLRLCSSSNSLTEVLKSNSEKFSGEADVRFKDPNVQSLLHGLVERNVDLDKVFKPRQETLNVPTYELLSDEELVEVEKRIRDKALERLQMPPVMHERKEINFVVRKDPEIDGHDDSNFIFTDISSSKNARNRRIVVREPNGVLREASWDERERMNILYLPKDGQSYELPPMLTDEHLPIVFEQLRHVDALDLVNVQCPPDSPDYLRVHKRAYDDIENKGAYYLLESTRHYGGMIYHFVLNKRIKGLILRLMREERIEDAADIVRLHRVVHPDANLEKAVVNDDAGPQDIIMEYAQQENLDEVISILRHENLNEERKEV